MEKIGYVTHFNFRYGDVVTFDKTRQYGVNVQIIPGSVTYPSIVEYGGSFSIYYKVQNISTNTRNLFGYLYKEGTDPSDPDNQLCRWQAYNVIPGDVILETTTSCPFNGVTESWAGTIVVGWFEDIAYDPTLILIAGVGVAGAVVLLILLTDRDEKKEKNTTFLN